MRKLLTSLFICLSAALTMVRPDVDARQGRATLPASYSAPSRPTSLREPVLLVFSVKNNLDRPVTLDLGQDRKENFLFTVTRPDGSVVELPRMSRMGLARVGKVRLEPGQTHRQELLLNEWYEFAEPGRYEIGVWLAATAMTADGTEAAFVDQHHVTIGIGARDGERLKQVCRELLRRASGTRSFDDASAAARKLSRINDPVAVPYLGRLLASNPMMDNVAVNGLERIGSAEAVDVLIDALDSAPAQTAEELIRPALKRAAWKSLDEKVKEAVRRALGTR